MMPTAAPGPGEAGDPREAGASDAGHSERKQHALTLFRRLPKRYDLLGAALSFGQDPRWRRVLVARVHASPAPDSHASPGPGAGQHVLDVATGTGLVAAQLLRRGDCSVTGLDQSPEMLAAARARFSAGRQASARVRLVEGEAERLPFSDGEFDAVTFTYLLRYVDDPRATVRELARVVRPGGRVASLEFGVPERRRARALWRLYTRVGLPVLGRMVSREWGEVGRFLGPSIAEFYLRHPLPRLVDYWSEAGLEAIEVRRMSLGGGIVMSATRSDDRAGRV
jgi:demethylmenaquinone methyltransferase/2-methoxy-6-polyprenyl-1,4-benzoquinol methylase